jgi:hypothetical protein
MFIRLRERHHDAGSPQSYFEGWDEGLVIGDLEAAASLGGGSEAYALRRLGYRKLLGKCVARLGCAPRVACAGAVAGCPAWCALCACASACA